MPEKSIGVIFIENLKKLLAQHNMSYKEFAEKVGVKASSISMWMTGNSLPRMGTLDKIADLFGVTVESLVTSDKNDDEYKPTTIAAHFDGDEYTIEELEEIRKFAAFVRMRRYAEDLDTLKKSNENSQEE